MAPDPVAPVPVDSTPAPAVKQGWKTTEFWLNLATVLVGAVLSLGPILHLAPDNKWMQIAGLAAMLLGATGHTVSRTIVKASMILVCFLALAGCSGLNKRWADTWTKSEISMMADLSSYVAADADKTKKVQDHLTNVKNGIKSIPAGEEQDLMTMLLAAYKADPKMSDARKDTKSDLIEAHLADYVSLSR